RGPKDRQEGHNLELWLLWFIFFAHRISSMFFERALLQSEDVVRPTRPQAVSIYLTGSAFSPTIPGTLWGLTRGLTANME
ncbi:MAG: hypothetical protein WBQ24_10925, partial [Xanthobacteraceae bacterium]